MVVNMAQKYVGTNRKLLIEYGMFGLRFSASRPWQNQKKKGAMAGFDPARVNLQHIRPPLRREVYAWFSKVMTFSRIL